MSGVPPDAERFISECLSFGGVYATYPSDSGGILFEFVANGWDFTVEFLLGGQIEMYGIEIDGMDAMKPECFSRFGDEFLAEFDKRTGWDRSGSRP